MSVTTPTDDQVDAAVRAFNGWDADHPMDRFHRRDKTWQSMRRALAAAQGPARATTPMVKRAAKAYEIGGACGPTKACGSADCTSAHEHRMRLALAAALDGPDA